MAIGLPPVGERLGKLTITQSERSGFKLCEASWPVLKGETMVRLRHDPHPAAVNKEKGRKS